MRQGAFLAILDFSCLHLNPGLPAKNNVQCSALAMGGQPVVKYSFCFFVQTKRIPQIPILSYPFGMDEV